MKKKIAIIGAGFSGMSAAAYAARAGHEVHVFEQHHQPGGRARQLRTPNGYTFDMGPSWYWMPDVIENFFADFHTSPAQYFKLQALDPQFEIIFPDQKIALPQSYTQIKLLFNNIEPGAGEALDKYMHAAKIKYQLSMEHFIHLSGLHWRPYLSPRLLMHAGKLSLLRNFKSYTARFFKHPYLQSIMQFPVLFLGAAPQHIPAMYSLMNYGGYALGTHYPMGGFYQLVLAMEDIAQKQGAQFHYQHQVQKLVINHGKVDGLMVNGQVQLFDAVIASADYHHAESLLPPAFRNYSETYWQRKTFAPSALIYYLGVAQKIPGLQHHTLFFENDIAPHLHAIYHTNQWPEEPLFYCCCPSKTDATVAPAHAENLFLLMPLPIGINDDEAIREKYLAQMLQRIEKHTGMQQLASLLEYKQSYCVSNFTTDYNAYAGNAYGLANTLRQTAMGKPSIKNKNLPNMFYAGQLTVPGPGVPPAIISGKIVAAQMNKCL